MEDSAVTEPHKALSISGPGAAGEEVAGEGGDLESRAPGLPSPVPRPPTPPGPPRQPLPSWSEAST
jgi:hypothetical protein